MTVGSLLAPALGIALSPFGIIPAILLQFTPAPRANGLAFLAGWALGVVAGFLLAAALSELLGERSPGPFLGWLRLLSGVALLVLGVRRWRIRHAAGDAMPGWMAGISSSRPSGALRLGLILSLANPKVLLLAIGAGLLVAGEGRLLGGGLLSAGLGFAAAASLAVAMPLVLPMLFGRAVLAPLDQARYWLIAHNGAITAILLLVFGVLLVAKGISAPG